MIESSSSRPLRLLQAAAYVVIVAWGIKAASHILSMVLISLLLSYVILPLPMWLRRRFHLSRSVAIALTMAFVAALYLVVAAGLVETGILLRERLPLYAEQIHKLSARIADFLGSQGIHSEYLSGKNLHGPDQIVEFAIASLPQVLDVLSFRLFTWLLSLIFLIEMIDADGAKPNSLAWNLVHYGKDAQRYIVINGQTGAMVALANLLLLWVLGVDFPLLWCFLYFFLQFIPSIGFLMAMVPPALVALLMLDWKRALLVVGGLILTQMSSDYVIQPMLMKKSLHVSLLQIILSLLVWGFLLGPAGAVLAVPLTMALKKYLENSSPEGKPSAVPG
jgi:AI-2 transport protein TqsA